MTNGQGENGHRNGAQTPEGTGGNGDLDDRLRHLESRLSERRRAEEEKDAARARKGTTGWGNALRLSSEFIAAVIVGVALGWALDYWAGTSPWGLIVFLLLGFAAGVVNVMRATGQMAEFGQQGRGKGS